MTKEITTVTENADYKNKQLEILRQRVIDDESLPKRTDTDFLTRFLRAKAYHVNSAFYMLKGYYNYNEKYTDSWLQVSRADFKKVLATEMIDILPGSDSKGSRVFWFRFGKWNPSDFTQEVGLQMASLIAQIALLESTPMSSIIAIYDLKDTGFSHAKSVTPNFAKKMTAFLTCCVPMHIEQTHIIREPVTFSMLFSIFKAFLDEKVKKRIFVHGTNMDSLHKYVDKTILPKALGGENVPQDPLRWNDELQKPNVVKEMERAGYSFTD